MIVGTCAVKNGSNTFLCTEKEYDFILELEIQADKGLNFRGKSAVIVSMRRRLTISAIAHCQNSAKRVHGYQVEVDHRPERRWSGGIYEEGRREWLHPLATNSPAGAVQVRRWNKSIASVSRQFDQDLVNDIPAADLVDAETLTGFIGLQVFIPPTNPDIRSGSATSACRDLGSVNGGRRGLSFAGCVGRAGGRRNGSFEDGVLHALHSPNEAREGRLSGQAGLSEFTIRMKYKIAGGFSLDFRSDEGEKEHVATITASPIKLGRPMSPNSTIGIPSPPPIGKSAWWNLNGHQLSDTTMRSLHSDSLHPGLVLTGGEAADIYFKGFEIPEGAQ